MLAVVKVISNPTSLAWSQVHEFSSPEHFASAGDLVLVVCLKKTEDQNANLAEVGKEIFTRFHQEYLDSEEKTVFRRLAAAVKKAGSSSEFTINIISCLFWKNYVYFCLFGKGEVFLSRGDRLHKLFSGEDDRDLSFSGQIKDGDIFCLATEEFTSAISTSQLESFFEEGRSIKQIADDILPLIYKKEEPAAAAALLLAKRDIVEDTVGSGVQSTSRLGIAGRVKNLLIVFARRLPERDFVADPGKSRRRAALAGGIILLVLFITSAVFGIKQKNASEYKASYQDRLVKAQNLYQDSLLKKDIDPASSRGLFREAQTVVASLESEGIGDPEIKALSEKLSSSEAEVLGMISAKPILFLDLSLLRDGLRAEEMVIARDTLYILDTQGGRIVTASGVDKKTNVFGGEKTSSAVAIANYSGRTFVLVNEGILELDSRGGTKLVIEKDSSWEDPKEISAFTANLYLLDKNTIWRYLAGEAGFGKGQAWLSEGAVGDLTNTSAMSIDGSIWIAKENGVIEKYTRGVKDVFRISALETPISAVKEIYTDEILGSIFVLDAQANRIIEFDKKGEYKLQYVSDSIGSVRDFVVSANLGKIFLLGENKILEIPLGGDGGN